VLTAEEATAAALEAARGLRRLRAGAPWGLFAQFLGSSAADAALAAASKGRVFRVGKWLWAQHDVRAMPWDLFVIHAASAPELPRAAWGVARREPPEAAAQGAALAALAAAAGGGGGGGAGELEVPLATAALDASEAAGGAGWVRVKLVRLHLSHRAGAAEAGGPPGDGGGAGVGAVAMVSVEHRGSLLVQGPFRTAPAAACVPPGHGAAWDAGFRFGWGAACPPARLLLDLHAPARGGVLGGAALALVRGAPEAEQWVPLEAPEDGRAASSGGAAGGGRRAVVGHVLLSVSVRFHGDPPPPSAAAAAPLPLSPLSSNGSISSRASSAAPRSPKARAAASSGSSGGARPASSGSSGGARPASSGSSGGARPAAGPDAPPRAAVPALPARAPPPAPIERSLEPLEPGAGASPPAAEPAPARSVAAQHWDDLAAAQGGRMPPVCTPHPPLPTVLPTVHPSVASSPPPSLLFSLAFTLV